MAATGQQHQDLAGAEQVLLPSAKDKTPDEVATEKESEKSRNQSEYC